jgi:phosphinothricin acetyltransferase
MAPEVRDATVADLPVIVAIYNEIVANSDPVYTGQPTTLAERASWHAARVAAGYPVLVACDGDEVLGFASFGDWRTAWPGYRFTVEHTVHVRADRRAQGVGTSLLERLIEHAGAIGKHVMVGAVDAANEASIRFHEHLGFTQVAHFREVGHKLGGWLDLVFMQRMIDGGGPPRS